ncbi:MAG: hypothetical protein KC636_40200 [Myxococcales bacterium]|nr:hypothetical protein [Myxococcales bacterium]
MLTTTLKKGADPGKAAASILFATGMAALSAAGPIGMAASAIIGFAALVFSVFTKSKDWEEVERKERAKRAFQFFPPLQEPGSDTDEFYVRQKIFPTLQTGSWTSLFSPRFSSTKEWVGAPRNGGFAFAPGDRKETIDEYGVNTAIFEAATGVGYIPGFNRITSVVQVSLDPLGSSVEGWYNDGSWPIQKGYVTDVGSFYLNATRLCAIVWAWATQEAASPHLYKIDFGRADDLRPGCLHNEWRGYCQSGLDYLIENGNEWFDWHERGLDVAGGRVKDPRSPEYLFGTAIGCAIGSWACYIDSRKSTNYAPVFHRADPGYLPEQLGSNQGLHFGCVIRPMSTRYKAQGDVRLCLTTIYHSHITTTLTKLRERQEFYLKHSLVCAYVRETWDAFKDPKMLDLLRYCRETLLTHKDRHLVELRDVPADELHNGANWRDKLKASGVHPFAVTGALRAPAGAGAIEPTDDPAPQAPADLAMPFSGITPDRPWWTAKRVAAASLSALALGASVYAWRSRR